jgi:hypothetical protein
MSMSDYDSAISRQSDRPLDPQERKQIRYIVFERFWSQARWNAKMKRMAWWVSGAASAAFGLTQMWEPIEKFWSFIHGGKP